LPDTLTTLLCTNNEITLLDNLPPMLTHLYCSGNEIVSLDNLPITITRFYCDDNPLEYNFEPTLENIRHYVANDKQPVIK
jgi:Leucine-rich repeat (LRR) protein